MLHTLLLSSASLFASPTYNEYRECIDIATNSLEYCLMIHHQSQKNDFCWNKSKSSHNKCLQKLMDSDNKKLSAKRQEPITKKLDQ